jgi:shikimate kinase
MPRFVPKSKRSSSPVPLGQPCFAAIEMMTHSPDLDDHALLPVGGPDERAPQIIAALKGRAIVLVGLMGSGKSSIGKRLAHALALPFCDADTEIELAAKLTIPEIFQRYGEPHFRDREAAVIARLLGNGVQVLATGGGAYMNEGTRRGIQDHGVSIWLKADLETLMRRVKRRSDRPLLKTGDPEATMRALMEQRYPVYALADLTVDSRDGPHDVAMESLIQALIRHLEPVSS